MSTRFFRSFSMAVAFATLIAISLTAVPVATAQDGFWNIDADGDWSTPSNWLGDTIPGTGGTALFGDAFSITGQRTINLSAPTAQLSGLTFDAPYRYRISGPGILNIAPDGFTVHSANSVGVPGLEGYQNAFYRGGLIGSTIAGTSTDFTKTGAAPITLFGTNTFTAPVFINQGILEVFSGDVALGNASNSITINGGILQIREVNQLITSRDITIGDAGGTIRTFSSALLNGRLLGSGTLVTSERSGQGTRSSVNIRGDGSSFSGVIKVADGVLSLSHNGVVGGSADIDLGGVLELNNHFFRSPGNVNNNNRIDDSRSIISRGGTIYLTAHEDGSSEQLGQLIARTGGTFLFSETDGSDAVLTFAGLTRENRSTVGFVGDNLGSSAAGPVGHIAFNSSPGTLIGGGGDPNSSTKASILPFAVGIVIDPGVSAERSFVTWDSSTGRIIPVNPNTGYHTNLATAAFDDNVSIVGNTSVNVGGQTINALRLGSALTLDGGASDVLTINSGAIVTNVATTVINAPINFASGVEGIIHNPSSLTINGVISGNNGLTKGSEGTLRLTGNNTYSGVTTLTRGITRISTDVIPNVDGAFGNSDTAIVMSSTSEIFNADGLESAAATGLYAFGGAPVTIERDIVALMGGGQRMILGVTASNDQLTVDGNITIDNSLGGLAQNGFLTIQGGSVAGFETVVNGIISGNGGLSAPDLRTLVLNGNNTYSGGTQLDGTVVLGHDNSLGTGAVEVSSNSFSTAGFRAANGPRTIGNDLILSNNFAFGGSDDMTFTGETRIYGTQTLTVDNARTTMAGTVSGGSLVKSGTGILELLGTNSYVGTTTVTAGTLLVNNATGNGTGRGSVLVQASARLGGSGFVLPIEFSTITIDGAVAPGNSAGTLTFGSLGTPTSVDLNGSFEFEIAQAGTGGIAANTGLSSPIGSHVAHDLLNVFGTLELDGSVMDILDLGGIGFNPNSSYSWLVATTNGGLLVGLPTIGLIDGTDFSSVDPGKFSLGSTGFDLFLNYSAGVPEPSSAGMMAIIGSSLLFRRRRSITTKS